ncbi:hypothetical protein CC78DRAFT_87166 [Lojkania enalia]|uniref:F-box domain-containing protein n=1 Tax=Lojkania enalia TaxID=147567 RepID=A0A9P4N7T5_9PLEO|nr:hypothetical protein CC78DRAFT_87166 [Didymosphaeria enalia]
MDAKKKSTTTSTTSSQSSKSAGSAQVNFLDLPKGVRNKIYSRVLIVPHPLFLFQEPGCRVETFAPDRPFRWLALLYTNRQISHEASAVLYRINHFHLVDITEQQFGLLRSFLDCIGHVNAASLSHLDINFPVVESIDGKPGALKLRDDNLQSLELLRHNCTTLSTLEALIHSKNFSIFRKTDDFLREALLLIDAQFRAISSLKKIIIRVTVYDKIPTSATDYMEGLGWVVVFGSKN